MTTYSKFVLFFFLLFSTVLVAKPRPDKDSLNLIGKVYNNNSRVRNVIINIYERNELFKTIHVKSTNRFTTNLPYNKKLTVEITAEDYHTKRFIIDSSIDFEPKIPLKYEFDIDIFQEKELAGINPSFLDFPVGLVSYDKRKEEFLRDKKYTKQMKKTYLNFWAEAQSVDRQSEGLD